MASHDLGDMEQIRLTLQTWIRENVPGEQDVVLQPLSFPEASGESSVTLILKVEGQAEQPRFICRMEPLASEVFDSHNLPLQYRLMEIAGRHGVPVPPLLGIEHDASLLGSVFYLMGFVEGDIPPDNPPYAFGSWVTELSDGQRATMWGNGLNELSKIHCIDLAQADIELLPAPGPGESPAQEQIDKFKEMFDGQVRDRVPASVVAAVEYVRNNAPAEGDLCLCWGDSRVGNVIWRDLAPVAIIDWEMASRGSPLLDVSWWYWIDYVNCVGLGVERPGGLPTLEEIYARWSELTGLSTANSQFYDLFNVLRYAIILEKKLIAMESAGIEGIGNFCVPILEQKMAEMGLL